VFTAILVASRFMADVMVGKRDAEHADAFVARVASRLKFLPLFVVDNWKTYRGAFLRIAHRVVHRRRKSRSQRGCRPGPRLAPRDDLLVAVVNKVRDAAGNLVKVSRFVLYGTRRAVKAAIKATGAGEKIATSYIERLHATMRSQTARMVRRTRAGSMLADLLEKQLFLWRDVYNWVRVHGSLDGRTPAMTAGLTDHAWTVSEYVTHPVHRSPYEDMERAEQVKELLKCPLDPRRRAAA
jgi:IS1 family transposase